MHHLYCAFSITEYRILKQYGYPLHCYYVFPDCNLVTNRENTKALYLTFPQLEPGEDGVKLIRCYLLWAGRKHRKHLGLSLIS